MNTTRFVVILSLLVSFALIGPVPAFDDEFPDPPCLDPWCVVPEPGEPTFEFAIRTALDGEKLYYELVSNLPIPIPDPSLQIPVIFKKISADVVELRSENLVSNLPIPIPDPNKAVAAKRRALQHAEQLERKIIQAERKGWIGEEEAADLLVYQASLTSQIETLPLPIPAPED